MPAWKKAGGLLVSEPGNIMSMRSQGLSLVAVDLRDKGMARKGHIPGAVNIPAGKIMAKKGMFPEDMSAPIILYTDEGEDTKAFETVRGWGYKNTSVLKGGMGGWRAAKGRVLQNQLVAKIDYVKVIPKGQVGIEEFKKVADSKPKDKLILDVRDSGTAAEGMIRGAVNIPQADLADRLSELPKDKEILVHCNTGILASMAAKTLSEKGYKARYLDAVVLVDADGSYEITEK
jgi:rhodanese-related sulfurtransferase